MHDKFNYRFQALAAINSGENVSVLNRCLIKSNVEREKLTGACHVKLKSANLGKVNLWT